MLEDAFGIRALTKFLMVDAWRDFLHVELMQELAVIACGAQATEPVLTHLLTGREVGAVRSTPVVIPHKGMPELAG